MKKRHHHKMHEKKHHGHHGHMSPAREEVSMMRERMVGDGYYEGYDARRRQEKRDGSMIHEDHHAMANLPQEPIMRYYSGHRYMPEVLDDTIRGIDMQIDGDDRQAMKQFKPHKY